MVEKAVSGYAAESATTRWRRWKRMLASTRRPCFISALACLSGPVIPYVDLLGFVQKNGKALDYLIEDAKNYPTAWSSKPPTFMLCNDALPAS